MTHQSRRSTGKSAGIWSSLTGTECIYRKDVVEWRDRKYELPAPFFSATPESLRLLASCIKRGPKVYTGAAVSVPRKAYQAADMLMAAVLPPSPGPHLATSSRYIAPQASHDGGGWTLVKVVVVSAAEASSPLFTIGNVCMHMQLRQHMLRVHDRGQWRLSFHLIRIRRLKQYTILEF